MIRETEDLVTYLEIKLRMKDIEWFLNRPSMQLAKQEELVMLPDILEPED